MEWLVHAGAPEGGWPELARSEGRQRRPKAKPLSGLRGVPRPAVSSPLGNPERQDLRTMGRMPRAPEAVMAGAFSEDESEVPDMRTVSPADQPMTHGPVRSDPSTPVRDDARTTGNAPSPPANVVDSRGGREETDSAVLQHSADTRHSAQSSGIAKGLSFLFRRTADCLAKYMLTSQGLS